VGQIVSLHFASYWIAIVTAAWGSLATSPIFTLTLCAGPGLINSGTRKLICIIPDMIVPLENHVRLADADSYRNWQSQRYQRCERRESACNAGWIRHASTGAKNGHYAPWLGRIGYRIQRAILSENRALPRIVLRAE